MKKLQQYITKSLLFSVFFVFGALNTSYAAAPIVITVGANSISTTGFTMAGYTTATASTGQVYFKYSTVNNQTLSLTTPIITLGAGGTFIYPLTNLTSGTYYFQAFVLPTGGTAIPGATKSITVTNPSPQGSAPSVTTIGYTAISQSSATISANVISSSTPTSVFFQYSTSPSLAGAQSTPSQTLTTTSGVLTANLTNLSANTTYYFRAVATNMYGMKQGATKSLLTTSQPIGMPSVTTGSATSITQTTAVIGGSANGMNITATGFDYGTSSTSLAQSVSASNNPIFSATLTGLTANTTYYFRAKATNSTGTGIATNIGSFTTISNTPPPPQTCQDILATNYGGALPCVYQNQTVSVTTNQTTNITTTSATFNSSVLGNGVIGTGFNYGLSATVLTNTAPSLTPGTAIQASVYSLTPNTMYFVRAYATTTTGTVYAPTVTTFVTTSTPTPLTCTDTSATNYGGALPCQYPQQLCMDQNATNYYGTLPCTYAQTLSVQTNAVQIGFYGTTATFTGSYTGGTAASMRFKYDTVNPPNIGITAYGSSTSFSAYPFNLIQGTTYYVQACATSNANIEYCGNVVTFTTSGGNNPNPTPMPVAYPPIAQTQNAQINGTSATLSGFVDMKNLSGTYYFEYGTTSSLGYTSGIFNSSNTGTTVSATINNLNTNTTYYYRVVAQNSYGTSQGTVLNFNTSGGSNGCTTGIGGNCPNLNTSAIIVTTVVTNVTQTSAQWNGIARNVTGGTVWFEYGRTKDLGYTTNAQSMNNSSTTSFYDTVHDLESNTIYYFRAVGQSNGTTVRGDIIAFRTKSIKEPKVVVVNNGTGTGIQKTAGMVTIENTYKVVCVGDVVEYTLIYKNTTGKTLKDTVLEIKLPGDLTFNKSTVGAWSSKTNTLTVSLKTLTAKETGEVRMQAKVSGKNDNMVTTATLSYTLPNGTQEQAIAYDIINTGTCSSNGNGLAGLALFGADGFFPHSLLGWLILTLVIFGLIVFTRTYFKK